MTAPPLTTSDRPIGNSGLRIRTSLFFNRREVIDMIGQHRAAALARGGRYVQKTARSLIKRKGKARLKPKTESALARWRWEALRRPASPPGTPPFTHNGFLRDDILFAFDPWARSMVIGPHTLAWLNRLHEFGGTQSKPRRKNKRRRIRTVGDGGEIRISGPIPPDGLPEGAPTPGYVHYCYLRTQRQADRANRLNERLYGPDEFPAGSARYPARPFMSAALAKAEPYIGSAWIGSVWAGGSSTPGAN